MSKPTFKRKRVFGGRRQREAEPEDAVAEGTGQDTPPETWTGAAGFRSMKKFKMRATAAAEPIAVEPIVPQGSDGLDHDIRTNAVFDRPLADMYDLALSDTESEGEARPARPRPRPLEVQPLETHIEYLQDHLFVLKEHLEEAHRNVDSLTTRLASASAIKLQLLGAIAEG